MTKFKAPPLHILRLPSVVLRTGTAADAFVESKTLLEGKRVLLFGGPGAFCKSYCSQQLKDFNSASDELKGTLGLDVVAYLSANDPFVLEHWSNLVLEEDPLEIVLLSDPKALFLDTLCLSKDYEMLGKRAERFAIVLDNGTVEEFRIEEDYTRYDSTSPSCIIQERQKVLWDSPPS